MRVPFAFRGTSAWSTRSTTEHTPWSGPRTELPCVAGAGGLWRRGGHIASTAAHTEHPVRGVRADRGSRARSRLVPKAHAAHDPRTHADHTFVASAALRDEERSAPGHF
eukprot:3461627-Prymnesium_polylepis.1